MGNDNSKTPDDSSILTNPAQNLYSMPKDYELYTDPLIKTVISQISGQCHIVLYDPKNFYQKDNSVIKLLMEICTVYQFNRWKEAALHIKNSKISCFVIFSCKDGEALAHEISQYDQILGIYIYLYCENVRFHNQWTNRYGKIVLVTDKEVLQAALITEIICLKRNTFRTKKEDRSLLTTLNQQSSGSQILSSRLKEVIMMIDDRDKARRDFLNLAKALCQDYYSVEIFERGYQPELILEWLKGKRFLYDVANSCLRRKTLESIMCCRSIVSDLQRAIWKIYLEKSVSNSNFSGRLYQEVDMDRGEWEAFQRNVGRDFALTNFFQAKAISEKKKKRIFFEYRPMSTWRNVEITIIVPERVDEDGQGFANISEDRIIFNIFSRFHILTALTEKSMREERYILVLIYCTQAQKKDNLKFSVSEAPYICQFCEESFERGKNQDFYSNLFGEYVEYTCHSCFKKNLPKDISPLLRVSFEMAENQAIFQAKRAIFGDKLPLGIPFVEGNCSRCKSKNLKSFYKCLDCKEPENIWCQSCVKQKKECQKEEHWIVYEKSPSSFYNDMTNKLLENANLYEEAENLEEAGEDDKTLELYHEVIKKNQIIEAETYQKLGRLYIKKKESQRAEQYFQKALLIMMSINEESLIVGEIHKDLGEIKEAAGDLIIALGHYFKALEIFKEIYGLESEEVLKLNNMISETYQGFMKKKREMIRYLREAQEAYEKSSETYGVNSPEMNEYKEKYLERFRLWKEYQDAEEKFPDFVKEISE